MKRLGLIATTLFIAVSVHAANDAGLPGEFLNFGVGARPLGMGRAFTAVSDDVDALYWNPAGMGFYRANQVSFQYTPLPVEGSQQYVAYTQPLYTYGSIGAGIINVQSGSIERTDGNLATTGNFDYRETGYLLGYGQKLTEQFGLGGTLKMAQMDMDGATASGFGADLGSLWVPTERLRFGLMIRNALAPTYDFDTEKESFPRIARAGAAVKFLNDHLLTSVDLEKTMGTSQGLRPHLGVEGFALNNIYLRGGWDKTEVTTGLGIRWRNIQFDYGAGFQKIDLVNRFTVKILFGGYNIDIIATPETFSPVGLKNKVTFRIKSANRNRITRWIMSIRNAKNEVVTSFQGYNDPPSMLEWDGKNAQGQVVEPGRYTYRLMTTDNKERSEKTPARTIRIVAPSPFEIEAK